METISSDHIITAPWVIKWIGVVLREIPAPTSAWADLVGALAWPVVALFLVFRFRWFLRRFLLILASRAQTADVRLGPFELTGGFDKVLVLDPNEAEASSPSVDSTDVQRIERIFEVADGSEEELWARLIDWWVSVSDETSEFVDFLESPDYVEYRERAFNEVEGLTL